jgi:hypothetical protein
MKKIILSLVYASIAMQADTNSNLSNEVALIKKQLSELKSTINKTQEDAKKEKMIKAMQSSNSFNQKDFMPDMALILNASAVTRDIKNSEYERYNIDGFTNSGETVEIPFNKNRGFNFNYVEMALHSNVGPYFDANAIFHLQNNQFEIGEAFITSRQLPFNLQVKAGKFKSKFGRINSMHQHAWKFMTFPLVYDAMFGAEGINDAGITLQWIAPTKTYLMVGAEALQGINDVSFGDVENNNLYVSYLKSGFDIGEDISALAGVSVAHGKNTTQNQTDVYGADLTIKYIIDSYSSISWQSEYLYRNKDIGSKTQKQSGYYTQLTYDINSNWEIGARYDAIIQNIPSINDKLDKTTSMVCYKPFEFTKIRIQYSHDNSKSFDGVRKAYDEVMIDFLVEAGAHGAHGF